MRFRATPPVFGFFGAIAAPVQQPSFGDGAAYRLRVHHLGKTGGWGGFTSPWVRHIGSAAALYVAGSEELPVLYNKAKTGAVYQIESEAGGNRTTVGKGHWGDSGTPSYSPAQMANVREGLRLQRMYYYKQPGAPLRNEHPLEAASGFLLQHMYSSPRAALENIMDDKWCGSSYLGSSWPLSYVSAVVGFDCGGCYPGGKATLEEKLRIISTLVYNSLVRNAVYGAAPISSAQAAAQLDKMIADCQRKKTASRARLPAARPIARTHSPTPVTTITRQVTRAPASMPTRQITRILPRVSAKLHKPQKRF